MKEKSMFPQGCIAVLGMFDGVHIGHQALLQCAGAIKREVSLAVVMVTFDQHPKALFGQAPKMLTTNEQKKELALCYGADEVLFEPFDQCMRALSPKQFIADYLIEKLNVRYVVAGENYRFGYEHAGTAELLQQYPDYFKAEIVPSVYRDGKAVSSSHIRSLLQAGNLTEALACLGHSLEVEGRVEHGRKVGRRLGFCTANITGVFPPLRHGVYLTYCFVKDQWIPSISNFGIVPTFDLGDSLKLECHLLRFRGEIYQQMVRIRFEQFVRPERHFEDEQGLKKQVLKDIENAKQYFGL